MAKQETRGNIGTYRRPGTASAVYDPGATILEGIEQAGEAITGRIKTVRDFENAASVRRQETLNSLAETEGMKDFTALDSLQQQLMSEIDELYRLDIASFEGDRSAYLKKQNEMQRVIGDIPALMGLIDQEAELLKENEQGGNLVKTYLKSNNEDYYNFVDRASKGGEGVSFRVENGNIIAQLDGKDVFNGHAYINAKKDGYDLVEYAGDYSEEINAADAQAYKGLEGLVKTEILEKVENSTELTREEMKDYTIAKQKYIDRLESGKIPLPINESTYQTFTGYGEDNINPYGEDKVTQDEQTREAVIKYMVKQRFPEDVVTTKIETEVGSPMNQFQKENLALQREKLRVKKFELLQKGQVDEKVINTLNKNAEYTNIINSIITEEGDEANAVDRLAGILNRVNSDQNVNYVAGSNDDIIAQIAKDRGIDLNDADAKAKLLEEEAGKIYIQKSGGKFSEIQFDINDPNEIFEILSKNTTGISNKDILNYGYEVGEFKPGKDKFDPKQDYKTQPVQKKTEKVETSTDKNNQTVPPPPPQKVEEQTEVEVPTEIELDTKTQIENRIKKQGGKNKLKNVVLKTNINDGKDYLREMLNFENSMGDFEGNSVINYGFSGTGTKGGRLLELYEEEKGSAEEKALSTIDKYIIGSEPSQADIGGGNKTILQDLNMSRSDFDKLPTDVKRQLVDWKFNSGRGTTDLIAIASGIKIDGEKWDGTKAFEQNSPDASLLAGIDISKLSKESLVKARKILYEGRLEGLKNMPDKKSEYNTALKGYNNSQKYR
jgi:hypothetical protein